jgi:hypothetical protein
VLSIDGSGTVRRLPANVPAAPDPAKMPPLCVTRFTKDTPAIRRIAPRNEFVMFMIFELSAVSYQPSGKIRSD